MVFINKKIMIIGGTGSLGHELIKQLYKNNIIIVFSRDEKKQWELHMEYPNIILVIGNIRERDGIRKCLNMYKPNIIINTAALKHIDVCETNIEESIQTNIIGTQNVIDCALDYDDNILESVLMISTDKGCSPINVYGMCKAISERLIVQASTKNKKTRFLCVRYGNVLNSNGSIIPKFKEIGTNPKYDAFTLTDENMTRFHMTLSDSIKLIITTLEHGETGDTFIPDIKSFNIADLANYYSIKYKKPVKKMDIRPGEKIHEILINMSEIKRTDMKLIDNKKYYIIKPCYKNYDYNYIKKEYSSSDYIDFDDLLERMKENGYE